MRYEAIKPFKTILDFSDCQQWLPLVDMFKSRKIEIEIPWNRIEVAYEQLGQLHHSYAN